jgi:hypothetical protein
MLGRKPSVLANGNKLRDVRFCAINIRVGGVLSIGRGVDSRQFFQKFSTQLGEMFMI